MKLEMSTNLTERDKKLLVILGIIVVVVGFLFLAIRPLYVRYQDHKDQLADAKSQQEVNQKKEQLYQSLTEYDEKVKQDAADSTKDFYNMLTSDEIDKLLTDMAVKYHLDSKSLNIQMPDVGAVVAPYLYSAAAEAQTGSGGDADTGDAAQGAGGSEAQSIYGVENAAGSTDTTESESDTEAPQDETQANIGIYQANVSMQLTGAEDDLKRMIDVLTEDYPSIRVTAYALSENTTVYTDAALNPIVSVNKMMNISMEIYMYATEEEASQKGSDE